MNRWRLWAIALGGLGAVTLLVGLLELGLRLQTALAMISPFLGQVVGVAVVGVGVGVAGVTLYYGWRFTRPRRSPPPPTLPQDAQAVAHLTLGAVERQLAEIQDQVAQAALQQRAAALGETLAQGDVRIVVFGIGSVGKTALVNRLLGEAVGTVAAPLGSTTVAVAYPLQLPGVAQILWLTDTPGLQEASVEGAEREAQVRQLATEADLLLFVIDNDLRQSEYALIDQLLTLGKRLVVVFNKVDRYPEAELSTLLAQVRSRLQGRVAPEDIVDVAADPQPIALAEGGTAQMDPDIWPLTQRLTTLLRSEGATLLAETLLLRAHRLGAEVRQVLNQQRRQASQAIVERYQWISAGVVAASPLPGVDLLATAAINAQMVVELGRVYRCSLSLAEGKALALALARTLGSLGLVKGAMGILSVGMQATVATAIASRAFQGVTTAYLTHIAGQSFITYFEQNQDWGDGGIAAVVEQQFHLNRREAFIQSFIRSALAQLTEGGTDKIPH